MKKTQLQVALDFLELDRALRVADAAMEGGADMLEAGTPLIKSEGLDAVRALRDRFPGVPIVADTKTMDAGKIEAEAAASAGADVMTVLAVASRATIRQCVDAGGHYGIAVAADLIGTADPVAAARLVSELGCGRVDVHCAIDRQMEGGSAVDELARIRAATDIQLAAAGGLNSETAPTAAAAGADVIVVGGAVIKARDVTAAAAAIRAALDSGEPVASEHFKRATPAAIREILRSVRTSNVSDGAHRAPCLAGIRPLQPGLFACGPAVTVRTVPGDWAKPVEAIDTAAAGDILVVDAAGVPPAVWGELASESALNKGLAGLVVNGAVRDSGDIRKLGFPVWTKHVTSHAGDPHGLGTINVPVVIAGTRVMPGDWIIADDDGVMVIPAARAVELANRAADILETENRIRAEITDGNSTLATVVNLKRWEKKGAADAIKEHND